MLPEMGLDFCRDTIARSEDCGETGVELGCCGFVLEQSVGLETES